MLNDTIFTHHASPAALSRYLYYPDHLVRMPHPSFGIADNLWSILTEPVYKTLVLSLLKEVVQPARDPVIQDESIGDFLSRRFGSTVVDRLVSAVLHGIYAGDVWQLSAKSLFPDLWRTESTHGGVIRGMLRSKSVGVEITRREADFLKAMKTFPWEPLFKDTIHTTSVFTFRDGISMLSDKLYAALFETGRVQFKTDSPIESIKSLEGNMGMELKIAGSEEAHRHTHIISTLSSNHLNTVAGRNLTPFVPSVNVMTVNLYFRSTGLHEPGFGYLIPRATPFENNPERALGVVFDNAYSPTPSMVDPKTWHMSAAEAQMARDQGHAINVNDFVYYNLSAPPVRQDDVDGTKLTVMLGGHWWDGWPSFPDEKEGLALAKSVLERHLGIKEEPEAWQVNFQKDCIPQYVVGHEAKLKVAHNSIWSQYRGRLRVAGNWMAGVGVNDCIRSAYDVVQALHKDGTGLEQVGEEPTMRMIIAR
jgi:oxygen-dependent protoporphyrinogen oxidase